MATFIRKGIEVGSTGPRGPAGQKGDPGEMDYSIIAGSEGTPTYKMIDGKLYKLVDSDYEETKIMDEVAQNSEDISTLNSSITAQEISITTSLTPASVTVVPTDNYRTSSYVVRAGICFVNVSVDVIATIGDTSIGVCTLPAGLHSTYKPPSWSTLGASSPNMIAESLLQNGILYIRNASVGAYAISFTYPVE